MIGVDVQPPEVLIKNLTTLTFRLIIAAFVILGVTYSVVTPIFEAPDELFHFAFVRHLATGHGLPVQKPDDLGPWEQEGSQPPLYYLLGALVTFWIDTSDAADRMRVNPHAAVGRPESDGNKNIVLHGPGEGFPYRGTALAVQVLRLLSVCLGTTAVWMVYLIAREVFPPTIREANGLVPVLAAGLMAFNPQFIFITSAVNNDGLIIALSGVVVLLALRLLRQGGGRRQIVAVGVSLGLALLTKLSALSLLAVVAVTLSLHARRQHSWRFLWQAGAAILALAAGIAGWWYLRNWQLYGDLLGLNAMLGVVEPRILPWRGLLSELEGIEHSFWAVFGWFNVLADRLVYRFVEVLLRLSLLGLALGLVRRRWTGPVAHNLAILALWLGIVVVALFRWTSMTMGSQGRLLFPAVPAIGLFLALGLLQLSPQRYRRHIAAGVMGMLLVLAVVAPFRYIAPAYARPPVLSHFDEALVPQRVHIRYRQGNSLPADEASLSSNLAGGRTPPIIELIGYDLHDQRVVPGETLGVTLYWRALAPMADAYSIYIHLHSPDGVSFGQRDSYPGRGTYPTFLWQPGQVIVDTYQVPVTLDASRPVSARAEPVTLDASRPVNARAEPVTRSVAVPALGLIEVGLYTFPDMRILPAFDSQDNAITPVIGRVKIHAPQVPEIAVANPLNVNFGDQIILAGWEADSRTVRPGETLNFLLIWKALATMDADYTVFVHLVEAADQSPLAQADGQPQNGHYPTSIWDPGEMVPDARSLDIPSNLPPGEYRLVVGLYQLATRDRLPRADGGDSVELAPVQVVAR